MKKYKKYEQGQTFTEYAIIITFLALLIFAVFALTGKSLKQFFFNLLSSDTVGKNNATISESLY